MPNPNHYTISDELINGDWVEVLFRGAEPIDPPPMEPEEVIRWAEIPLNTNFLRAYSPAAPKLAPSTLTSKPGDIVRLNANITEIMPADEYPEDVRTKAPGSFAVLHGYDHELLYLQSLVPDVYLRMYLSQEKVERYTTLHLRMPARTWRTGQEVSLHPKIALPFALQGFCGGSAHAFAGMDHCARLCVTDQNGPGMVQLRDYAGNWSGFYVPSSWLTCWGEEQQTQAERLRSSPRTDAERRVLQRMRPILEDMAANWYDCNLARVEQKYVELLRGLRSNETIIRTSRFIDRLRNLRHQRKAEIHNHGMSMLQRVDHALKTSPPRLWPKGFEFPGEMIGIELEFIPPHGYTRPNIFGADLHYDGSVRGHADGFASGGCGDIDTEASLAVRFGQWGRLEKTCTTLQSLGCVANKTCGLHVHLDMRGRNEEQVRTIARRMAAALPLLNCLVPETRWRGQHAESYCKQGFSFRDRYHAINGVAFHSHGTLEIRLFSGSLNAEKIRRWVELLHWLSRRTGRFIRTMDDFLSCKSAPQDLKRWAVARWHKLYPVLSTEPVEVSEQ